MKTGYKDTQHSNVKGGTSFEINELKVSLL